MAQESRLFASRAQARHFGRIESERAALGHTGRRIVLSDLRIELQEMRALVGDQLLDLTLQEFELLVLLAQNAGRPVPQRELALTFWDELTPRHKRHLSVLIARLRAKLSGSKTYQVETVRKRGYGLMFKAESA
jgi:two-component system alkaline phosphatase synthesis response regulator PhoP